MAGALADDVNLKEEERAAAREARQRQQQEEREWLDQVAPKATGRWEGLCLGTLFGCISMVHLRSLCEPCRGL